jgi:1-phosphatidylinositol phosphodiesterase
MESKKTGKAKRLLHLLWIIPLVIVLAFGTMMYLIPAFENVDRTEIAGSSDWMAMLDDSRPLSEVVLPGTHDSATANVQLAYFSKCQALDIGGQLEAGFRYLDIRLGVSKDKLKLMHGFTNCTTSGWPWAGTLTFDSVLGQCYDFLSAHPTETIVLAVKHEHGSETAEQFEAILSAYISEKPEAWLLTDAIPTVGEARGKLVLLRHYEDPTQPDPTLGIKCFWKKQKGNDDVSLNAAVHDEGSYRLSVQDRYEYEADDKWNAFVSGLQAGETGADAVSIHFLSTKGKATFGHPFAYAKKLNERLLSCSDPLSGWIVVDFASAKLAQRIYMTNFAD